MLFGAGLVTRHALILGEVLQLVQGKKYKSLLKLQITKRRNLT